jgi:hypothetical protein
MAELVSEVLREIIGDKLRKQVLYFAPQSELVSVHVTPTAEKGGKPPHAIKGGRIRVRHHRN